MVLSLPDLRMALIFMRDAACNDLASPWADPSSKKQIGSRFCHVPDIGVHFHLVSLFALVTAQ
jgi:hypothetical protein